MPTPAYQHLSGAEDEDERTDRRPGTLLLNHVIRPHTYYGEGPFDAPSSDDEDDGYLDKETREQGSLEYSEPDNGLRVGGRQVE